MAVLNALAHGDSNREIGRRLGIHEETVKKHVSVLIQKLHVRNRVQLAVLVALEMPELLHQHFGSERCGPLLLGLPEVEIVGTHMGGAADSRATGRVYAASHSPKCHRHVAVSVVPF